MVLQGRKVGHDSPVSHIARNVLIVFLLITCEALQSNELLLIIILINNNYTNHNYSYLIHGPRSDFCHKTTFLTGKFYHILFFCKSLVDFDFFIVELKFWSLKLEFCVILKSK